MNIDAEQVIISGDVVGRDKIVAGGDVALRDMYKIVFEAPAPTVTALHGLRAPVADFTGRADEIDRLRSTLQPGRAAAISNIGGMGGVGKTELAIVAANHLKTTFPDAQIVVDMRGTSEYPLSPTEAMWSIIRAFHPDMHRPNDEAEIERLYRSVLDGRRALLLLDNAASAAQVRPLIPPAPCALIVTSRRKIALPGLLAVDLDTLPLDQARELLLSLVGQQRATTTQLERIAELCGRLPLALRIAGSFLAVHPDWTPDEYIAALFDERARLARLKQDDLDVEAALGLSYEQLARENADWAGKWLMLAVFPATFGREAAAVVWNTAIDDARDALSALVERSLALYDPATARYRLHDLMRLFADARLQNADRAVAQLRHASHYAAILYTANKLYLQGGEALKNGLELFDLEWTNFQAGQVWAEENATKDRQALELCDEYPSNGFEILPLRQHPRQRIAWLKKGLEATRKLRRRQAEGLHLGNLGTAYADLGEIGHATGFFEQALLIARETGDRRNEEAWLNNLGTAHVNLSKPRRAIQFYEEALAVARELGVRRDEGQILANLGAVHATLNELPRAIEYHERGLTIARDIGDRRSEGFILGNLGNVHSALGEHRRAIEFYEQRLVIAREINDLRGEAYTRFNLADELNEIGEYAQAIVHAEAALKIFEQLEDPNTAKVRKQLAEWRGENSGSRE